MSTSPPSNVPEEFESQRLTIRAPRVEDAVELHAAVSESIESLRPWMPWAQAVPTVEDLRENLRAAREQYLAREDFRLHLFLKGTSTLVGCSGFHRADWSVPKLEIGYWVRGRFAGQGYITEAVRAIAAMLFETLGAHRVEIRMSTRNERSRRVAERAGFELEGILRNDSREIDGRLRDTMLYARVRGESNS